MKKETDVILKDLFMNDEGGYIPMTRRFSRVLGFNAAGLLEDLCDRYDYYKSIDELNEYGEFFYIVSDVEINTGLTKSEQATAIKKLKEYKFIIDTPSRGMPKKRFFKMAENIPQLLKALIIQSEKKKIIIQKRNNDNTKSLNLPY